MNTKSMSVLAVFLMAFCARTTEVLLSGAWANPLKDEPSEEVILAQGLAEGFGFITPIRVAGEFVADPSAYSAPGYPAMLATIIRLSRIVSDNPISPYRFALVINIFLGCLAVVFLAIAAGNSMGHKGCLICGTMAALWPTMIRGSVRIWDTAITLLAIAMAVWLASKPTQKPISWARAMLLGIAGGVFTLFNPVIGPFWIFAIAAHMWNRVALRTAMIRLSAACLACAICVGPWLIRNAMAFHRFVPVRNTLGYTFWIGNLPGSDGTIDMLYAFSPLDNPEERRVLRSVGEDAYMQMRSRDARKLIRSDVRRFARLSATRFRLFWIGNTQKPTRIMGCALPMIGGINLCKIIANVALLAMALWGSAHLRPCALKWLCWFGLACFPMLYYFTHVSPNYRVLVDPLLITLASASFALRINNK